MKIFLTSQIRQLDQFTIEHEPISSVKLMERAADALFEAYTGKFGFNRPALIFAGQGNNGGDALALARKLLNTHINVRVILLKDKKLSPDCELNKIRLEDGYPDVMEEQTIHFQQPEIKTNTVIVDGLFGSGLSKPLEGIFAEAVAWINQSGCEVLSIDIPSGLHGENNANLNTPIVKADYTFTLQFPKLAFLFPETAIFAGDWSTLNINIHPKAIETTPSPFHFLTIEQIAKKLKKRPKFSHKGTYGHALIFAGTKDMAGAAVLAGKAAMRSGTGLVTIHSAACNRIILQSAVPELIFESDNDENQISEFNQIEKFDAIAVGSGIGTTDKTQPFLKKLLEQAEQPLVIDADALNIISKNSDLLDKIPQNSILTPHPKEFERLFGSSNDSFDRMQLASDMAQKHQLIIVLKGAHTQIYLPDGTIYFNSTGNSGMATAGSGDVLTGILSGLLAQGYYSEDAALTGVFLHGLSAQIALQNQSEESLMAGDIIENLGHAFSKLRS